MSRHALQRFIIFLQNVVADFHILKKFILPNSKFQTDDYKLLKYNSFIEETVYLILSFLIFSINSSHEKIVNWLNALL